MAHLKSRRAGGEEGGELSVQDEEACVQRGGEPNPSHVWRGQPKADPVAIPQQGHGDQHRHVER